MVNLSGLDTHGRHGCGKPSEVERRGVSRTASLTPPDAVDSALNAAEAMRMYNLPDPNVFRTTTRERTFEKKKFNEFKRRSFYDMQLNTEAGQIKYLGEATLGGQCHVPYMQAMLESS